MAASVPGLMGIHWWAKVAVESVYLGSMEIIFIPASLAWTRYQLVLVSAMVLTGSHPQRIIRREFSRSSRVLAVQAVP